MPDADIQRHEGNFICWDDITVYLKIKENQITAFSYDWNPSTISLAAASFLSEFLIGTACNEVLEWTYSFFLEKGFEVSPRREKAVVIALLGVKNAIHQYYNDGIEENFDDILEK